MDKEQIKKNIAMRNGGEVEEEEPLVDGKKYIIVTEDMRGLGLAMQEKKKNGSEVLMAIIPPCEEDKIKPVNAVIEVDGMFFDGYDHGDAMDRAESYGCDTSEIDRYDDGLFRLSDGSIITRQECMDEYNIEHSHEIPDDERNLWKNGQGIVQTYPMDILFNDRENYKDWYWIYDSNHGWEYGETLIEEGFKVFGGTEFTYKMEEDREEGIKFAESCGLFSPEVKQFSSVEEGVKFLEEEEERSFVYKPNNQDCTYTTVPRADDPINANKEISRCIKSYGFKDYILQERVKGIEACAEVWFSKGVPLVAFVDLEDKLSHNGGMGAPAGCHFDLNWEVPIESPIIQKTVGLMFDKLTEMKFTGLADANVIFSDFDNINFLEFCFDDKTEIMTKNGWKFIKDVPIGTEVATINKETNELEYQSTTDLIIQDYKGEMVKLDASSLDVLMTPNHHQYAKKRRSKKYEEIEAKDLKGGMSLKRDVKWNGQESSIFIIPEYIEHHYLGKYKKYYDIKHPSKTISMDDWLSFLGYYLSEGSLDNEYSVNISQFRFCDKIEETLKRLPFEYRKEKNGFRICSKQLGSQLSQFGKCNDKFIPSYVKELSPRQIEIFLAAYILGDGSIHKRTGQRTISTTSKIMADDLSELILKCGNYSIITERKIKGTSMTIKGKTYIRNHNQFVVSERKESGDFYLINKHIKKENYNGKVYCVTTPNHTIYVRRNGKAVWTANCFRQGYNAFATVSLTLSDKTGLEALSELVDGEFNTKFKKGFGASVNVNAELYKDSLPIYIPESIKDKVYLYDARLDEESEEEDDYVMCGISKEVSIAMGHDYTPATALQDAMHNASKVYAGSRSYYRSDADSITNQNSIIRRYEALVNMKLLG